MRLAVLVLMLTALVASAYRWTEHDPLPEFPRVMLWAWERPEDLRGLGSDTGVAFLAQTISLHADQIATRSPYTVVGAVGSMRVRPSFCTTRTGTRLTSD